MLALVPLFVKIIQARLAKTVVKIKIGNTNPIRVWFITIADRPYRILRTEHDANYTAKEIINDIGECMNFELECWVALVLFFGMLLGSAFTLGAFCFLN